MSSVTGLENALWRIAQRGLEINTVIDVGASNGQWSAVAERFWPDARYHLVEAFDHWKPALEMLVARKPNYSYVLAAAGPREGEAKFNNSPKDPAGGVAVLATDDPAFWTTPMVTIDSEVRRLRLAPPFLIKLDTHGFERAILDGARETLQHTNLLINEFYNFHSDDGRWPQMAVLFESLGFRCIDFFEPVWRPHDGVLWQFDLAFVPRERREFLSSSYGAPGDEQHPKQRLTRRRSLAELVWATRGLLPERLSIRRQLARLGRTIQRLR